MVETLQVMMEIGIIMLFAFIGAGLAAHFKQSVIIGYILAGIVIGPFIHITMFGYEYNGLVTDTTFIAYMSQIGLILLMFFVGLEFSISKLKKTKGPAIILAMVNTGIDFFMGIVLGLLLGWPMVDTIFLAGVVAMGSAAITGKSLMELQKLSSPETEFLLGMVVVEDFISMIVLTVVGSLVIPSGNVGLGANNFALMLVGVVAFYIFFIFLAIWVVPKTAVYFQRIKNDELFILFALGLVFISGWLALVCGVPAIIGAFFLGMVFAETKLAERFDTKLGPLRDVFVAIFFVFFGMLINPAMFGSVITIVLMAVPLIILGDLITTGAIAYLLGFSGRAATFMGSSMCGRGAESIMYASVGSSAANATMGAVLNPFAGLFCFVMSVLTPIFMRFSDVLYRGFSRILPTSIKQSASVMSRTMGKIVLPSPLKLFKRGRRIEYGLTAYFVLLMAVAFTEGWLHIALFAAALGLTIWTLYMIEEELVPIVRHINYENLGAVARDGRAVAHLISYIIFLGLLAILLITFVFPYEWWLSLVVCLGYLLAMIALMTTSAKKIKTPYHVPASRRGAWTMNAYEPIPTHLSADTEGSSSLTFPLPASTKKTAFKAAPPKRFKSKDDRNRFL
ncbi:MAG: cation:proton antiporter [Methanomassiliicoccales archaeon]|jgi:CPA2 family monovalent cation:H+ antiporter-2|nr:cation:proton antiporter [Methanomassiliicoccales archaeon]